MDKSRTIKSALLGVGGFFGMGARLTLRCPMTRSSCRRTDRVHDTVEGWRSRERRWHRERPAAGRDHTGSAARTSKPNPWYPDRAVFNATKDEPKGMLEFTFSTE